MNKLNNCFVFLNQAHHLNISVKIFNIYISSRTAVREIKRKLFTFTDILSHLPRPRTCQRKNIWQVIFATYKWPLYLFIQRWYTVIWWSIILFIFIFVRHERQFCYNCLLTCSLEEQNYYNEHNMVMELLNYLSCTMMILGDRIHCTRQKYVSIRQKGKFSS